jgi:RND family efflux transporter MFP subunit
MKDKQNKPTELKDTGPGQGSLPAATGKKPGKGKAVLIIILAVLILAGGGFGFYWLDTASRYFQTDNAKVTAKMYTITPATSGKLLEWIVSDGETVTKNQNLGRQEILPYLVSPINGTVVKNNGTAGQIVSPATHLAVIADTDHPYIGVNIEETDITKIKVGQTVDVWIDAYGSKLFNGIISEIDLATQQYFSGSSSFSTSGTYTKVTQLIPVKVLIENPDNLPMAFGMNATVRVHLKDPLSPVKDSSKDQAPVTDSVSAAEPAASYISSIEAKDQISVLPDISGKVTSVHFKIGQVVKTGDALFEIDSSDLALQVRQATSSLTPLSIASKEATANYNRMQKLFVGGAISAVDRDAAKAKADSASAQMESAQASLDLLLKKLDSCTVKAPMDGQVASKLIATGNLASPQAPALTLVDNAHVIVRIGVTESDLAKIKLGDTAHVIIQAVEAYLTGQVDSIAPVCDAKTGLFPVEITLDNPGGQIKPGMKADVSFQEAINHG